ncbi:hypothetical protein [uncultured Methylobacterium sp.]|uniref:hypothetical protein n=1 Tax=uncultured Methylobacterium sp. TaxID=157278 RepID=UPI0035CB5783
MRIVASLVIALCAHAAPVLAQGKPQPRPAQSEVPGATSDEKAAEVKRLIEVGQARQRSVDEHNTRIWKRWDYAVCIGCGPMPKKFRIVYTTPERVLAGVLAADDDDARGRRIVRRSDEDSSWTSLRR